MHTGQPAHTNRLIHEKSPYLLQHAHNPVEWRPWGEEAFEEARRGEKPIFLSVGYSTCHWCHVMERESFENEEIAAILNRDFVPVKVDREERPDVDRIYMLFVQATSGGGGWPMSVWLAPDLKPFYGGTYFPPTDRWGRPGFKTVLEHIARAWREEQARITASGESILSQLRQHAAVAGRGSIDIGQISGSLFQTLRRGFDTRYGGWSTPKFPRPVAFTFLLRHWARTRNPEALEMTVKTLRAMAAGGMNDQLGGGFHRYSVDARWFVPHFEKMLYDQAQLAVSYLEAYQVTGDAALAESARAIFRYVMRDLAHPEGGFYSAEDADSVMDPANPGEKGEGAFYIWSRAELDAALAPETAAWFSYRFGVEADGNVAEDPHGEFTGRNILFAAHTVEETAARFGVEPSSVSEALNGAVEELMRRRNGRIRPHLDDKILVAWNGLMISAFAKGYQVLGHAEYLECAQRAAEFIHRHLVTADGVLLRRYRDGEAAIPGFLDDYAFHAQALLDLYEADFDAAHLKQAIRWTDDMLDLFEDRANGAFFSTTEADAHLVLRMKDDYDGAEPSGNSVAVMNLARLAHLTGDSRYRLAAERAASAFSNKLYDQPVTAPNMVAAVERLLSPARQVVIAGDAAESLLAEVRARFLPATAVLRPSSALAELAPAVAAMTPVEGRAAAYVCENFTCRLPVVTRAELAALLQ
ncbi:MAG: thioredoxin domain-containing protein [Acidobacteria bacterium]|nr:thioredoxin domain-containing protein [Acidobacteriota bacterium]